MASAFSGCSGLASVTIPSTVTEIMASAFSGCSSLNTIYSFNPVPPTLTSTAFDNTHYKGATLYVPQEAVNTYQKAMTWKRFQNIQGFDPAGINGIEADGNGGAEVCYDMGGRRLHAPKKGLNIVNGKKTMVR